MALVVFLRGVNVGGHKTFRPSLLAKQLSAFDVVNIGAAGTFVVRKPISQAKLRAELLRSLPFETQVMICKGADVLDLVSSDPFSRQPAGPNIVRFVSVMVKPGKPSSSASVCLPSSGKWCLKVLATNGQFVLGLYRREMRAIRYLGELDRILGTPVTTRNWNTIAAVAKVLQDPRP